MTKNATQRQNNEKSGEKNQQKRLNKKDKDPFIGFFVTFLAIVCKNIKKKAFKRNKK